jgi:hypothetical protein
MNMRPPEIAAAWERGDIDAAFIWDPVLSKIKDNGKAFASSRNIRPKGFPAFDGVMVNAKWAAEHEGFMVALVKALSKADAEYRANKAKWTVDSPQVEAVAKESRADAEDVPELPKVLLIYPSCLARLALAARSGMKGASQEQINAAYSLGASYAQVIRHVILPSALPEILVGMRIAVGFGWTTLVAAEMVAANVGLGQMVLNASNFLRTDIVIMGIVVIGAIAYLFDLLMRGVERRLVPWKGRV